MNDEKKSCIVLFSGGTDSTAAAASLCSQYSEIHLLTFFDQSNKNSSVPHEVVNLLREKFQHHTFVHKVINTDSIVKELAYKNYFQKLFRYRWVMAMTCGFTSLSWHLASLKYALDNNITTVADGLTKEMMHLPGHMPHFIEQMREIYSSHGLSYQNPVREWKLSKEKDIEDKFIINQHDHLFPYEEQEALQRESTTGTFVFELGLFPSKDVKGSRWDSATQHDCYPFVLYNILYFWLLRAFKPAEYLEFTISGFFKELADSYLKDHFSFQKLEG